MVTRDSETTDFIFLTWGSNQATFSFVVLSDITVICQYDLHTTSALKHLIITQKTVLHRKLTSWDAQPAEKYPRIL